MQRYSANWVRPAQVSRGFVIGGGAAILAAGGMCGAGGCVFAKAVGARDSVREGVGPGAASGNGAGAAAVGGWVGAMLGIAAGANCGAGAGAGIAGATSMVGSERSAGAGAGAGTGTGAGSTTAGPADVGGIVISGASRIAHQPPSPAEASTSTNAAPIQRALRRGMNG